MKYIISLASFSFLFFSFLPAQEAQIYEETRLMVTYPFSQPDPIPTMGRIYPYFRFDGYSNKGIEKEWKMVVLENDYIRVFVAPEIGGKIWGAVEKSTDKEFLYFNKVVKFRDIAMRGPWTSGGLEYNFGDIGHIPTASTPVDYITKAHEDGSVSCIVGAIDLPSRTKWNVIIRLHPDKAYVETEVIWQNNTNLPVTYYHWMNAAAKAKGNLEFIYPGAAYIGHNGELGSFPIENDRNISFYEKNNFGSYKSYHVLNAYSNFFGGYWHEDDFGFGHLGAYDDKPGKKIWIWGLSDQGMIWEDLLTDNDGQYVEYQSGKLFNQASEGSTFTPFKHREFSPHDSDHMIDRWFPLKKTGGMVAASEYGVLNTIRKGEQLEIKFSALQKVDSKISLTQGGKLIFEEPIVLNPLELFTKTVDIPVDRHFQLQIGEQLLYYSSHPKDLFVDRPLKANPDFNWESAYGLFTRGLEHEKQRQYQQAHHFYQKSLEKEAAFAPSLNRLALSFYRKMEYEKAYELILKSLAIDTYDPEANYLFGLINEHWQKTANAKSGFGIAAQNQAYRNAGLTSLARMYMKEGNFLEARRLCKDAFAYHALNTSALEMLAIIHRLGNNQKGANATFEILQKIDPTSPFLANEKDIWSQSNELASLISNELSHETYLELALLYYSYGQKEEAINIFKKVSEQPISLLWLAHLEAKNKAQYLNKALTISPSMVFPHRRETLHLLESLMEENTSWKLKYYAALIYWNIGRTEKARALFSACQNEPDFVPFYLAKANLFSENKHLAKQCHEKAVRLEPQNWRANLINAKRLFEEKQYIQVINVAAKFLEESPAFGMIYAKALIKEGSAAKAATFLEKYEILPFEGAREGRQVFHEACIRAAQKAYKEKDYTTAINFAQKASLWPRNLGVGKPYEVDNRMEHFILFKAYNKKEDKKKALQFANLVRGHQAPNKIDGPNLLLQAALLKIDNQKVKANELINAALVHSPENQDLEWIKKAFSKDSYNLPENASDQLKLVVDILKI